MIYVDNTSVRQEVAIPRLYGTAVARRMSYLTTEDIADDLATDSNIKALSARQGVTLKALVDGKQAALVSGTNIKTINGASILGSGNINIETGGVSDVKVDGASVVTGGVANVDLSGKQDTINDLATIRSNAAMAVSALHSDDETANITGDWAFDGTLAVQNPTEEYQAANKGYVDGAVAGHHDSSKQDTITDLATIRSNAATGAGLSSAVSANTAARHTHANKAVIDTIGLDNLVSTAEKAAWNGKQAAITSSNKLDYSLVANTPTIPVVPANVSAFNNDAGYITDAHHDSTKQDALVSGSNIKTINGESVLGSGNIVIQGGSGGGGISDVKVDGTSVVSSGVANIDLTGKADASDTYTKAEVDSAISGHHDGTKANQAAIKCFAITEDMFDLTTTAGPAVAPYNTSYGYTDITIHADAGVEWMEGALYSFVLNTKVAVSAYRNVRVRIGDGDYKPMMGDTSSVLVGSSYFIKGAVFVYQYKNTYQANGALHRNTDSNSDVSMRVYRSTTDVDLPIGALSTATTPSAWADPSSGSYKSGYGAIANDVATRPTINPSTGLVKIPVGKYTGTPTADDDMVNKAYTDTAIANHHDSSKQDTISDLATIRSGAASGATAYQKPGAGIPKTDLAAAVQTSLGKADSALQSHQSLAAYRTAAEQDAIHDSTKVNEPSAEGTAGQVLTTDGNGGRTWTTPQGGGGGTPEVFMAEYGTTTYDEIVAAINAGKVILAHCATEPWEDYPGYVGYYTMAYYSLSEQRVLFSKGYQLDPETYNYQFRTIELTYNEDDGVIWQDGYDYMLPYIYWNPALPTIKYKTDLTSDGGLKPNCFYELGTLAAGESITFNDAESADYLEYKIHFKTGTTAPTIIWNISSLKWANGDAPTFEANSEYEISILGKRATCVKFA